MNDRRNPADAVTPPLDRDSGHRVAVRAARAAAKAARKAAGAAKRGRTETGAPAPGVVEDLPATVDAVDGAETHPKLRNVPEATVARLAIYLRALSALADQGTTTVSSEALATAAGVNSAKLRKDLSYLGSYGTRGVGYEVEILVEQISRVLGLTTHRGVVLVGLGNLGHALAGYGGFASRGFQVAALLDADPARIGEQIAGLSVRHIDELDQIAADGSVSIGVIATPAEAAQEVCDRLVGAGITSILNFAPSVLSVPPGVDVRKVDLAIELQILSFHEQRKADDGPDGESNGDDWVEVG
ncbi:MAG TPA: redox-sensing transcriptional repressor Rex [Mycobacteriales bacterium]|nr:redox-sensing transcriptional repressor Rex [Mycobacteriales bacterium]